MIKPVHYLARERNLPTMCEWGNESFIYVIRRNNPHVKDGWHLIAVDSCISDYVQEMNNRGILTIGCCCGHGKTASTVLVEKESCRLMERHGYAFIENGNLLIHTIGERNLPQ